MNRLMKVIKNRSTWVFMVSVVCILFIIDANAADIIKDNITDVKDTVTGSGKYLILLAEVILSAVIFAKTKNYLALGGVVVLSMYFNLAMSVIG